MENRQEEPRFSVIIVTCNRLALLKECVAHASNQEKMPEKSSSSTMQVRTARLNICRKSSFKAHCIIL